MRRGPRPRPPSAILALAALAALVSCGGAETPCDGFVPPTDPAVGRYVARVDRGADATTVHYRDGGTVALPAHPTRIVSTLPGLTELVVHLGAVDRLVAVSENCDVPEAADLPRLAVFPLDLETLLSLHPDLLLVDAIVRTPDLDAAVAGRDIAVLPVESRSLAHLAQTVSLLAQVLDTDRAGARAVEFALELERAREAVAPPASLPPPRVLLLAQADPVYVLGPGSLLDDMVRACGAIDVACDLGRPSGPFAEELVLARRPDVILVLEGRMPTAERLSAWASVPAVANHRVVDLGDDAFVRAGPRTPAALLRLAGALRGRAALVGKDDPR